MVNDLGAVGSGYAQATGYFSASPFGQVGSSAMSVPHQNVQRDPDVVITTAKGSFPILSEIKDGLANVAKAIKEAGKALDVADTLLQKMQERVDVVKDYPPYPAGNEERVEYIRQIEGLRKVLDALVVPRVTESYPPVFYPQESEFPTLDADVPSDAAVLAFGEAVAAVQSRVNAGRAELQAQADQLSGRVGIDLSPSQVQSISIAVAVQLGATSQPLAVNNGALVQLAG